MNTKRTTERKASSRHLPNRYPPVLRHTGKIDKHGQVMAEVPHLAVIDSRIHCAKYGRKFELFWPGCDSDWLVVASDCGDIRDGIDPTLKTSSNAEPECAANAVNYCSRLALSTPRKANRSIAPNLEGGSSCGRVTPHSPRDVVQDGGPFAEAPLGHLWRTHWASTVPIAVPIDTRPL